MNASANQDLLADRHRMESASSALALMRAGLAMQLKGNVGMSNIKVAFIIVLWE